MNNEAYQRADEFKLINVQLIRDCVFIIKSPWRRQWETIPLSSLPGANMTMQVVESFENPCPEKKLR